MGSSYYIYILALHWSEHPKYFQILADAKIISLIYAIRTDRHEPIDKKGFRYLALWYSGYVEGICTLAFWRGIELNRIDQEDRQKHGLDGKETSEWSTIGLSISSCFLSPGHRPKQRGSQGQPSTASMSLITDKIHLPLHLCLVPAPGQKWHILSVINIKEREEKPWKPT